MSLVDQIRELADRIEADLVATHDYYAHTKGAWRLVQQLADEGRQGEVRNLQTGTVVPLSGLAVRAQGYVNQDLAESVFGRITSLLEDWIFGLLRLWHLAYPGGIPTADEGNRKEKRSVALAEILAATDKEAIIQGVVDKILHDLAYKRPDDWFRYLERRVKLACPTSDQIADLAEIKAARDILIHNRGVANEKYREKAGDRARYAVGQRIEIREPYLDACWALIRDVVREMASRAIAKATPP